MLTGQGPAHISRPSPETLLLGDLHRSQAKFFGQNCAADDCFFSTAKKTEKRVLTWKRAVYISRLSVGKSGALKDFKIELRLGCLTSQELEEKRRRRDSLRT